MMHVLNILEIKNIYIIFDVEEDLLIDLILIFSVKNYNK